MLELIHQNFSSESKHKNEVDNMFNKLYKQKKNKIDLLVNFLFFTEISDLENGLFAWKTARLQVLNGNRYLFAQQNFWKLLLSNATISRS